MDLSVFRASRCPQVERRTVAQSRRTSMVRRRASAVLKIFRPASRTRSGRTLLPARRGKRKRGRKSKDPTSAALYRRGADDLRRARAPARTRPRRRSGSSRREGRDGRGKAASCSVETRDRTNRGEGAGRDRDAAARLPAAAAPDVADGRAIALHERSGSTRPDARKTRTGRACGTTCSNVAIRTSRRRACRVAGRCSAVNRPPRNR